MGSEPDLRGRSDLVQIRLGHLKIGDGKGRGRCREIPDEDLGKVRCALEGGDAGDRKKIGERHLPQAESEISDGRIEVFSRGHIQPDFVLHAQKHIPGPLHRHGVCPAPGQLVSGNAGQRQIDVPTGVERHIPLQVHHPGLGQVAPHAEIEGSSDCCGGKLKVVLIRQRHIPIGLGKSERAKVVCQTA